MKIPAINNNLFVQNNHTKQSNPSFQRIRKDIALSEKISHIIPLSDTGDIILIGKSFESAIEGVKNSLGEFSEVIKRILHIKASVAVPMAISLDKDGDFQCVLFFYSSSFFFFSSSLLTIFCTRACYK